MLNYLFRFIMVFLPLFLLGQTLPQKEVNHQIQTWVSLNNNIKFDTNWSLLADFHIRRNYFITRDNFYFVRGGLAYLSNSKVLFAMGYAHMWLATIKPEWSVFSNENRLYQQAQYISNIEEISILQRIRNEQRWQEVIVNDVMREESRFTNRLRYLVSLNFPLSKKKTSTSLVVSDEVLIHFGKEIRYNTFDQNRVFIGIKQSINPHLSFDFGYMNVYQQKYSGYQYDTNHTIRLFFYYNNSLKDLTHFRNHSSGEE
jgi:hypothetical protein